MTLKRMLSFMVLGVGIFGLLNRFKINKAHYGPINGKPEKNMRTKERVKAAAHT